MKHLNLFERTWNLQSWRPFSWHLQKSTETGGTFQPEQGPMIALLPGSAHTTLRHHGLIPDWNIGLNSLASEWVEHRHWEYYTEITAGEIPKGETVLLEAEGLDYSGWIRIDDETVGTFHGALKRHSIDLSAMLADGLAHRLRIIFDLPPEEQGQIGFTSRSKFLKPRYNFSWDWCVRLVPVGIWDALSLRIGKREVERMNLFARLSADLQEGSIHLRLRNTLPTAIPIKGVLRGRDQKIHTPFEAVAETGDHEIVFSVKNPELWWPNGHGEQNLYTLEIEGMTPRGAEPLFSGKIGFKFVRWTNAEAAPDHARPLLCEVNGKKIFIQGINWTPINLDYPDENPERYQKILGLYQDMGVNVLRVWGGAFLERDCFYRGCDERGFLVWQEFPLSSSGCDNIPPTDTTFIQEISEIARDYTRRRSSHVSLFLWCGGNELQTIRDEKGNSYPLSETHPVLAALQEIVAVECPGIRYLPTSPSGPLFAVFDDSRGKGLHHHVHAPWDRLTPEKEWTQYWDEDDAIFRSETGVTGSSSVELLKKYSGGLPLWPANLENPFWRHHSAWWNQEQLVKAQEGLESEKALENFVTASQERQARYLAYAVKTCKERFPKCTGFMIWMGHDCMAIGNNTSLIDFDCTPKPSYYALQRVFKE